MLNGIDPIIIFQFTKVSEDLQAKISKIPIVASIVDKIGLPPIPIYLSEKATGLHIDTEDRNIDIQTTVDSTSDGSSPKVNQKAINSVVRITMIGSRESIGLTLLSALADLVVPKVTSKEYSITYLHGAITIFGGLLHSFSVTQNADDDRVTITLELTKNNEQKKEKTPAPERVQEPVTLGSGGGAPLAPTAPLDSGSGTILKGPPAGSGGGKPAPVQLKGLG